VPFSVTVVVPVVGKLAPVSVTFTLFPRTPVLGETDVKVGPCTVNVAPLLVPPKEVTVTVLAESVAVLEIAKFAVI
jgi:hypothetical protein